MQKKREKKKKKIQTSSAAKEKKESSRLISLRQHLMSAGGVDYNVTSTRSMF